MALGRAHPDGDQQPAATDAHPGEPGVGVDLPPPFAAPDEATRWLFGLNRFGIRPGLVRTEGLLQDLGHPERGLRTLVVAGTNGKGSTTRILARLLQDAGHKVATYTSPHLLHVHERIQINDRAVEAADFAARVAAIRPLTEKHDASWFETLTALAVQIAHDEGVDYLCCETGLGGRLDASNALPPIATLLTTVGLDHQKILGSTMAEIAAEKLGLLKRGVPLFTGVAAELRSQAFMAAVAAESPCFFLDELARWPHAELPEGQVWDLALRTRVFSGLPDPGTAAMRRNVALALLALTELEAARGEALLPPDPASSLGNLLLPGRYQQVLADPTWIFDTAHNTQALQQALGEFRRQPCAGRRIILFGAMHDKDLAPELGPDFGAADHLLAVPISLPRSRTPAELEAALTVLGFAPGGLSGLWRQRCTVAPDLGEGLRAVAAGLTPRDRVLVTGSCFTVAEILHRLGVTDLEQTRHIRPAAPKLRRLAAAPPSGEDAS
jgi:dihydrofolate synthase/folylpolyglutamate synthase